MEDRGTRIRTSKCTAHAPLLSMQRLRATLLAGVCALLSACGGSEEAARPIRSDDSAVASAERLGPQTIAVIGVGDRRLATQGHFESHRVSAAEGSVALVGRAGASAVLVIEAPKVGWYELSIRWPRRDWGVHAVRVQVEHDAGRHELVIDQSARGGEWHPVGTLSFEVPGRARVTLSAVDGRAFAVGAARLWYLGAEAPAPAFASDKLPVAMANQDYRAHLDMVGGLPPYRFAIVDGILPEGLELDPQRGVISGRAARRTDAAFTLLARDSRGLEVRQRFALLVDQSAGGSVNEQRRFRAQPGSREQPMSSASSTTSPDLASLQTIVAGMAEGSWQRVNLNYYSAAWTPEDLRTLINGAAQPPSSIILAWSSFAWDSNRGNLFLYGGGHANYRGNDTYLWRGSTRMWERASLPSEMTQTPLGAWNAIDGADKAPASAHTYDNTVFLPILDRVLVLGGAADMNGGHYLTQSTPDALRITGPYLFEPSRAHPDKVGGTTGSHVQRVAPYPEITGGQMWSNRESWLNASVTSSPPLESLTNSCTGYAVENGRDVVYLRTAYRIYRYEINDINTPAADTWRQVGRYWYGGSGNMGTCAYDTGRRLLVSTHDSTTQPFIYWDMAAADPGNRDVLVAPTDPTGEFGTLLTSGAIDLGMCALEFDPNRSNFKLWCGDGRVWTLQPPATPSANGWIITKASSPTGAVPSESIGTGILGKWKHIPNLDVFMGLLDAELGNIWIYKPFGWIAPWGTGNLAPSVSLTSPSAGASFTVGSDIALSASAADGDGNITLVEFFANGVKIGQSSATPYSMLWSGAALGTHSLTARATDNGGASTTSSAVSITVNPVAANQPPSVAWVAPTDGASIVVGTPVTLEASASDTDGSVTKVEFFAGGSKLGEATSAPFRYTWADAPLGVHALTAMATDNAGATSTTAARSLNVTAGSSTPTTVTLQRGAPGNFAVRDTYLSQYHKTLSFGASSALYDDRNFYSPLFRFAVFQSEGGPVPNGATITSAVLSVYKASSYDLTYAMHRLLVEWDEATATWNQRSTGLPWSSAGANGSGSDYAATADASASVGFNPGWINFEMTNAVQQMSLGVPNLGWRLRSVSGYRNALKQFHSSEYVSSPALRPKLVITYQ